MKQLLNHCLCYELRNVINKTDIFIKDEEENKKFLLICAFMDRFDTAVRYINNHQEVPKSEEKFILFMVYSCIIKDGIEYIKKILEIKKDDDKKIFENIYKEEPFCIDDKQKYNDDLFFEYFRSLVFAHPLYTNRSIPNPLKDEKQYSPYILVEPLLKTTFNDPVGVKVYSNKRDILPPVLIPFESLKKYLKFKYEGINDIINGFQSIIDEKEKEWKKRTVDRNKRDIDVLKECKEILIERYIDYEHIEILIKDLTCESTLSENNKSINLYRKAIIEAIPYICNAIDEYEHERIYDYIKNIIYANPKGHEMMNYQLEKIFGYLNDGYGDNEWGLIQAEAFAKEFARKWVIIKPREMNFNEIKMLVRVACYLEYIEQKRGF